MDGPALIELFDELTSDLVDALAGLDDWGLSGLVPGQYNHDLIADEVMLQPLLDAGCNVLSEESGLVVEHAGADITVVVDPIDGSTNASHGLPWYATSLCAVDGQGMLAASVTNLATGERFEALRGEGVQVERDTTGPSGVTELSDALVALSGLPPHHGGWRQFRTYGAAALDMCAVAVGMFDAFVDVDGAHGVWDYLGAQLICIESGAVVSDGEGRDLLVLDPAARRAPIAAANQGLLDELLVMWRGWSAA
jgi:fructose-1,6-bisphosphatase/inositol monophosphatase family enzyme